MNNIKNYKKKTPFKVIFTDIDDTLTNKGKLLDPTYKAMWDIHRKKIPLVPITGRPAGWCELIARIWPVDGIIGENGGFYFRLKNNKMHRYFVIGEKKRIENYNKLQKIKKEISSKIPKAKVSSDQFCRLMDLSVDYKEDINLNQNQINQIMQIFKKHRAQHVISSIHINGWFGKYNKIKTCLKFLKKEFNIDTEEAKESCTFVGDSPNDQPCFEFFKNSFAVSNIKDFANQLKFKPTYVANNPGGKGFQEIIRKII